MIPRKRRGTPPDPFERDWPHLGATIYPTAEWDEWTPAVEICERCMNPAVFCPDHALDIQKYQYSYAGYLRRSQALKRMRDE